VFNPGSFFSQFGSKLKGIKTQAFQKLNQNFSKLNDFLHPKLKFSESLSSLNARIEYLLKKLIKNLKKTQENMKTQ